MTSEVIAFSPHSKYSYSEHHSPLYTSPSRRNSNFQVHRSGFKVPFRCLRASRRFANYPHQEGEGSFSDFRNWSRDRAGGVVGGYDDDEEEEDDEEEDRSLDLLIKFVENVFKKVSRKARKAVRSVLPVPISSKLVGFSVNGGLILTFLWVFKAFLEVVCTLGSVVFVSILLIRGIWTGISYLQEGRNIRPDEIDDKDHVWTGTQPAT